MIALRRAIRSDLPLLDEMIREFYRIDQHHYDEQFVAAALVPLLENDDFGEVLLFDTGYAVVTWAYSLESGGRHAVLDEFFVRTPGKGIGGQVIEEICARCAARGMPQVVLETEKHNDLARKFYVRHGFVADDSTWFSRGGPAQRR
ncbi:hypothetical protein UK23_31040 [Lentzea aerocolonigenes]|uniref:N-acetyltransferase domain-containing protein n=1 Tax=Lentzea aerocolonigenes TaxID=68170 RepID=A0A0F0GN42_LENAE|nr:GNAT family N-acetyltransferase [Lentzea aerocolonigenes]KJK43986.1 hypothetical protein UK23_31040 [Lentzea aerocolonigenes]